ncbi:hypothetical protein F2Q70_00021086 [Brassica cretica]|uniref:3-oxoacyl-[acyl-carrier-protein] reductase n=1 Tax=Brassica cretica TaxID=69181 RepID=A0A8S9GJP4_BRACR|nr:hypothetical protein F2Q70_00021086 [Brassica cretica]
MTTQNQQTKKKNRTEKIEKKQKEEHAKIMASYIHVVTFIGFLSLLKLLYPLLKWFITRFLLTDPRRLKSYGSWAMVTGATDGIGRAFAHELAKHGLNLILVSRNPSKLASVSDDFRQEFPQIKIKIIPFDFSSERGYEAIEEGIKGLEVGILINNVGITYPRAMFFHEVDQLTWTKILRVNLEATTWVTRSLIGPMVHRRRGAIINISSGAAVVVPSHPLYAIYAATKALGL